MKRFLIYCLMFAAIVAAILVVGEILCRHYPNPYAYKDRWLKAHAGSVETLILGSSVNYYGINPSMMEGCAFNLAGVSQNFDYDYLLLRRYFSHSDSLRRVILSVGFATLTDAPLEQSTDCAFARGYRIYMGIDRNPILSRYSLEVTNLHGFAGKLRNMIEGKNSIICDSLGHGTAMLLAARSPSWKDDVNITVQRHSAPDYSHVGYNLAYLDSILDWTSLRGVETILLSTPKHRIYRDAMPLRQKQMTWQLIDSIAASRGVVWIDLTDDPDFTDDDFYDGDHLTSDHGAERLTRKLNSILSQH